MSDFTEEDLKNLQELCRIKCTPEEEKELEKSLKRIINHVEDLREVNTKGIPPCNHVLGEMTPSFMREDTLGDILPTDLFMSDVPDRVGNMVRIPPIFHDYKEG